MKELSLLFLVMFFACACEGITVIKTDLDFLRKTYAGLSEKELDSVYEANPEMNDRMLEKAGLVKNGRLLVEKINHNS
ncbi:hypothetical protein OGH69_12105 [Flavobacterium sp. MFBS3-15]|uniref:hypothetical protein n=1 Tax=Flavobacterium sp. MFBS3-15 TaxID=2989816 RepID=UPI0022359A40|nr:hypothetical protein [Flavobacterium sp. MFBS3-15]MCW4469713.1 hypothetical protein [Flavobacterium sp. MFBS3-15]